MQVKVCISYYRIYAACRQGAPGGEGQDHASGKSAHWRGKAGAEP